jgi:hypothetical protein
MASVVFLLLFFSLLIGFFLFDKILRFQYRNHRNEWEKGGKAMGFFWIPAESSLFSGSFQRTIRVLSWTFGNEEWMKNEASIMKTAMFMRICFFLFWMLIIPFAIFTMGNK